MVKRYRAIWSPNSFIINGLQRLTPNAVKRGSEKVHNAIILLGRVNRGCKQMSQIKSILKFGSVIGVLLVLTTGMTLAKTAAKKPSEEARKAELRQKADTLRELTTTFAGYQTKAAYFKRDRAMLQQDAMDPMLSEKQRAELQNKIARIESEMTSLSAETQKNQDAFATVAKDYAGFMKANFAPSEEENPSDNGSDKPQ